MAAAATDSLPVATMIHMVSIKLSSTNYLLWKHQVIPMLTSFHLLEFVNGTVVVPSPTALSPAGEPVPNPAYTTWLDTDQCLLGVLFSTLSEEAMAEVVECTSSRDAWTTLEAAFSHSSLSCIHQLREELLSLRRGSLSVKDYGARFKALCDQLPAIGKPVDDLDKSHWFLHGLGTPFANFADARMSMQPISSFSTLLHQAIQFDLMVTSMDPAGASPTAAFTASAPHSHSQRQSSNNSSGGGARHANNSGGNSGNGGRGGRGGRGGGNGGRGPPRKPRCQICHGEHYADKCPLYLGHSSSTPATLAEAF